MNRGKFTKAFKKEDGAGLVLALMVLMVLAVLGVAVAGVTIGSHKLGHISRDSNSAYYIAEAGANLAYTEIRSGVISAYENANGEKTNYYVNVHNQLGPFTPDKVYASGYFDSQFGDQPQAIVEVRGPDGHDEGKLYTIRSTGEISGKSRTVEKSFLVKWVPITKNDEEGFPPMPVTSTLIAKNRIDFLGGSIKGDVFLDSQEEGSFQFGSYGRVDGDIYSSYEGHLPDIITKPSYRSNLYNNLVYQKLETSWDDYIVMLDMIKLPDSYEEYAHIDDLNNTSYGTYYINEDVNLNEINIFGSATLRIQNVNKDIHIVANNLTITGGGKVIFEGDGKVHFHILNQFTLNGGGKFNEGGDRSIARVYYYGNNPISIDSGVSLNSNLLMKIAPLTLSGGGKVTGAIITGGTTINLSGGSVNNAMIYAPKAHVNASGGGQVKGIFVAESFKLTGGTSFSFDTFDHGILFPDPTGSGGTGEGGTGQIGSETTLEDLITAGPALEP